MRWKPNKEQRHLAKRKAIGHLPFEAAPDDYRALIQVLLSEPRNLVYHYPFGMGDYYAVAGEAQGAAWLVLFGADGIMETAFPPQDLASYLTNRGFVLLGRVKEVVHG